MGFTGRASSGLGCGGFSLLGPRLCLGSFGTFQHLGLLGFRAFFWWLGRSSSEALKPLPASSCWRIYDYYFYIIIIIFAFFFWEGASDLTLGFRLQVQEVETMGGRRAYWICGTGPKP